MPTSRQASKVSVLLWRSSKLKRKVVSTLGGEALAFSQCVAEVEWLQIMYRDITRGDVTTEDWTRFTSPFLGVLRQGCSLEARQPQCQGTDAKSLYDALYKQCPTSRQDRRTAIDVAIIVGAIKKANATLRWMPHQRMIADALTKDDLAKTNGAFQELLKSSTLRIADEKEELKKRKLHPDRRRRSQAASLRTIRKSSAQHKVGETDE